MKSPMVLPRALQGVGEALTRAVREVEVLGIWPEGEKLHEAAQPKAIAEALIAPGASCPL